jgi:hypothetical protein
VTENWHVRPSLDLKNETCFATVKYLRAETGPWTGRSRALAEGELAAKKVTSLRN